MKLTIAAHGSLLTHEPATAKNKKARIDILARTWILFYVTWYKFIALNHSHYN